MTAGTTTTQSWEGLLGWRLVTLRSWRRFVPIRALLHQVYEGPSAFLHRTYEGAGALIRQSYAERIDLNMNGLLLLHLLKLNLAKGKPLPASCKLLNFCRLVDRTPVKVL